MIRLLIPFLLLPALATGCGATVDARANSDLAAGSLSCLADSSWPFWESYKSRFVSHDGRVIDPTGGGHSTSEGQSYGLFFALVANDRKTFETLLAWTSNNLAKGDLGKNLPAWKWGQNEKGEWTVLDSNSAGDADLWIAYDLMEAGRLWHAPEYTELSKNILNQVVAAEVEDLPGLGPMLLPGPLGFRIGKDAWRLNPSYLPIQLLEAFDNERMPGPWKDILQNTIRMIQKTTPNAFIADWVVYHSTQGFLPDPVSGRVGSHDAIRTYLWAGMLHDDSHYKAYVNARLQGMHRHWARFGYAPMTVDPWEAESLSRQGPVGFLAAILPEANTRNKENEPARLRRQIELYKNDDLYGNPPAYYDQNLLLFALGFADGRFSFDPVGRLQTRWETPCKEPIGK